MPASRPNVRQHVVPQVYLERFGDADLTLQVQDVESGGIYPGKPVDLCVEKEVYTLLHDRKRDDSCDTINGVVEGAIGGLYRRLEAGVDLTDEQTLSEVFTTLAVFTANLIARSRVLRSHFNGTLDAINQILTDHPDCLDDFPKDEYQQFLQDPQALKGDSKTAQALRKYGDLLRECANTTSGQPLDAKTTVEALKQFKKIHYPVLLKPRTGIMPGVMQKAGVKGDLLVPEAGRFISADDPVIFIVDGARATNINPADVEVWAASNRSVYLTLRTDLAIQWTAGGTFAKRTITADEVQRYNQLVAANAIRQRFALERADFPS